MELIHNGLSLENKVWTARYPWIKNPSDLHNKFIAAKMLQNTEETFERREAETYQSQVQDKLDRGVAKKLDEKDLNYDGPMHYIIHHEVLKQDSASTPCRIVFNASANYKNHVLNDHWAKGPDLLGNLLGTLIKFREDHVAYIGDIRKMYHTIRMALEDQHTHRFLWRDYRLKDEPDGNMMQVVSFGD